MQASKTGHGDYSCNATCESKRARLSSQKRLRNELSPSPLQPQRHPQQQPAPLHSFSWSTTTAAAAPPTAAASAPALVLRLEHRKVHDRMGSRNFPQRPSKHTLVWTSKVSTAGTLHLHTCMLPTSSHISDRKVPRLTEKVQPHVCDLHEAHFRMTKPPTKTKTPASDARAKADSPDSSHRAYRSSPDAQSRRTSVYSDESSTSVLPQRSPAPSPRRKLPHQKTSHRTKLVVLAMPTRSGR